MKQTQTVLNTSNDSYDEHDRLRHEFQDLPEPVRVRPIRHKRYQLRGGLSFDELERLGAMRLWEPLAGIPIHPKLADDFEPPLPDPRKLGCVGE